MKRVLQEAPSLTSLSKKIKDDDDNHHNTAVAAVREQEATSLTPATTLSKEDDNDDNPSSSLSTALLEMLSDESYTKHLEMNLSEEEENEDEDVEEDVTAVDGGHEEKHEEVAACSRTQDSCSRNSGNPSTTCSLTKAFFATTWQLHPVLYKRKKQRDHSHNHYNHSQKSRHPLQDVISMGWNGIIQMLEQSKSYNQNEAPQPSSYHHLKPLVLQNQKPLQPTQIQSQYPNSKSSSYAAYIDGCSIIQNHAEYFSIPISNLCYDLQKSFPHCYCNTYLTPPNSSTVKAHADDRDVFVIQIKGKKKWKVYRKVPIPYPYHHEQVGKNNLHVPYSVMTNNGPTRNQNGLLRTKKERNKSSLSTLIHTTLEEGDILYLPRGYVHEASTSNCDNQPSFHATIAIMTSDWSYSKTIADMTRKCLDEIPEHRMAIHVDLGRSRNRNKSNNSNSSSSNSCGSCDSGNNVVDDCTRKSVEKKLECIFERMKECITIETIGKELNAKYNLHNQNSNCMRKRLHIHDQRYNEERKKIQNHTNNNKGSSSIITATATATAAMNLIVGPKAASFICMESKVRASTLPERESVSISGDRGLAVRQEISDSLLSIVATMKENMDVVYGLEDLRNLILQRENNNNGHANNYNYDDKDDNSNEIICDFTLCSFVKCCVSLGVMSLVSC